jgi:hypothetical protein
MSSLLDMVTQHLGDNGLRQMSQQLGTDESTTSKAVAVALPLLLGGLARNASQPDGASALNQALEQDHDGSVLDNVSALVSNPQASSGAGILGHIFGSRQTPVAQGVSKATGLDPQQAGQLLLMLAPLVMGALARRKRQQPTDVAGLGAVLQQEQAELARRAPAASGLSAILDRNQDGNVIDDIARMAPGLLGGIFGRRS